MQKDNNKNKQTKSASDNITFIIEENDNTFTIVEDFRVYKMFS